MTGFESMVLEIIAFDAGQTRREIYDKVNESESHTPKQVDHAISRLVEMGKVTERFHPSVNLPPVE